MPHSPVVNYRTACAHDHVTVVTMLCELVDELGPNDDAEHIKSGLNVDIAAAWHSPDVRIFLATMGTSAVGLSRADVLSHDPVFRLRHDHRCGYIDQMYVRRGYRNAGVGAYLLGLCEAWFCSQDIHHCLLHAAPRAIRFYARTGYQPNRQMFKRI